MGTLGSALQVAAFVQMFDLSLPVYLLSGSFLDFPSFRGDNARANSQSVKFGLGVSGLAKGQLKLGETDKRGGNLIQYPLYKTVL